MTINNTRKTVTLKNIKIDSNLRSILTKLENIGYTVYIIA